MAEQTNFVKFKLMLQILFSFGLHKHIFVSEMKMGFTNNVKRRSIHFLFKLL